MEVEHIKKLLSASKELPTNWLSDKILDGNIEKLDLDDNAEWKDFPCFTRNSFIISTQQNYEKVRSVKNIMEQMKSFTGEDNKIANIVCQALGEVEQGFMDNILGVIDNQITFPNDFLNNKEE